MIHHINKLKNKNHMIILIDAGKLLTKFNTQDVGIEGTYLNKHNKGRICQNPQQT